MLKYKKKVFNHFSLYLSDSFVLIMNPLNIMRNNNTQVYKKDAVN